MATMLPQVGRCGTLRDVAIREPGTAARRPALHPVRWQPPQLTERARQSSSAVPLGSVRVLPVPGVGPEDVLITRDGDVLTGLADGRVVRVEGGSTGADGRGVVHLVAHTGGRPLGMEWLPDGRVLVCDCPRGLLAVDVATGAVEVLLGDVGGRAMTFCNNAAVAPDGTIWFTDSSTRFGVDHWRGDVLEHSGAGRLLRRDPEGAVDVVLDGLQLANGVALAADGSFLVVAQTGAYSLERVQITGERAGERERFVDLPGFPDNVSTGSDGLIWVAVASSRNPLLDRLHRAPGALRKVVWRVPERLQPQPAQMAWVMAFDDGGRVVHDRQGSVPGFHMATGVREAAGTVWMGSLVSSSIASFVR